MLALLVRFSHTHTRDFPISGFFLSRGFSYLGSEATLHQTGVEAPAWTTLPNVGAADRGRHWLNANDAWRIARDRKSWRALRPATGQAFHWLTHAIFLSRGFKGKGKGWPYSEGAYRRGAHLPCIGRWAHATPDLRLPSQPKLVLNAPIQRGIARLSWPGWLVTYRDSLPTRRRSPIQALTGPSVE